jgi:hypothetical protein
MLRLERDLGAGQLSKSLNGLNHEQSRGIGCELSCSRFVQ